MSEDNPYTLVGEIWELLGVLYEDLSDEYWDNIMGGCRVDIEKIRKELHKLWKWIIKKEKFNKKAEGG